MSSKSSGKKRLNSSNLVNCLAYLSLKPQSLFAWLGPFLLIFSMSVQFVAVLLGAEHSWNELWVPRLSGVGVSTPRLCSVWQNWGAREASGLTLLAVTGKPYLQLTVYNLKRIFLELCQFNKCMLENSGESVFGLFFTNMLIWLKYIIVLLHT